MDQSAFKKEYFVFFGTVRKRRVSDKSPIDILKTIGKWSLPQGGRTCQSETVRPSEKRVTSGELVREPSPDMKVYSFPLAHCKPFSYIKSKISLPIASSSELSSHNSWCALKSPAKT